MKPARILLLMVAIVAGGLAAYLATRGQSPAIVPTQIIAEIIEEPKLQVLVAAQPIGVGQRLSQDFVEWQEWPQGAMREEYITSELSPDAPQELTGTVARFEFFPGEPIREAKLVHADQGYLSAVLEQGMRGVSIGVSAQSGAGGFIVPNDRVDVVQTTRSASGDLSETILSNVKVLAIGQRLGQVGATAGAEPDEDPQSQNFTTDTIATLELNPLQAETIITASAGGDLTLVLRSIVDFDAPDEPDQLRRTSQSIRVIKFGVETAVQSGTVQSAPILQSSLSGNVTDPATFLQPAFEPQNPGLDAVLPSPLAETEAVFVPAAPTAPLQ